MRNGWPRGDAAGSTCSRCSSNVGPRYQSMRCERATTLSPSRADIGMQTTSLTPSSAAKLRNSASIAAKVVLRPADQIHLVDGDDQVAHAQRGDDQAVTPGLPRQPGLRIDQDQREIGGRGAGRHVARVLLVAGRVGDDEFPPLRGEEPVGDVDGDLLLALGGEPIEQEREVELLALRAVFTGIRLQRIELVVEHQLGFVQQAPDQGRLAVIDRAAGDETQQALVDPAGAGRRRARSRRVSAARSSEIAFLFLALHRGGAVVIDRRGRDARRSALRRSRG